MECYIGIDLGSTTTKAVYLDAQENIIGRGITNSRSNYDLACQIAREEAEISARFGILKQEIATSSVNVLPWILCKFKLAQHMAQLKSLRQECISVAVRLLSDKSEKYNAALREIFDCMELEAKKLYSPDVSNRSDFFRDLAAVQYINLSEELASKNSKDKDYSFDKLIGIFDSSILKVESKSYAKDFDQYLKFARDEVVKIPQFLNLKDKIEAATNKIIGFRFEVVNTIGTGYGRQRLPFPKHQIRSEILCHGLGAHAMFPATRTVLDIGGQDTKAIQVDGEGIVTNFQMNDRCAAGCGRYLGYIADEMNMGIQELGPMAMKATTVSKINSTCTVFAGAELRERLSLGERREDILAGLHRAIILRAMSLLARSGGIASEFTFTGGVARNEAAVKALHKLVEENYGKMKINISADSIFTGAVGAALFAKRDTRGDLANVDLSKLG